MFKIVTVFTRPNKDHKFFYDQYSDHEIILSLKIKFEQSQGFQGKVFLKKQDQIVEIAMCFTNQEDFVNFVVENKSLLDRRSELIREWCSTTGQTYNYYTETD
jgi:hypothetical protein